MTACRIGLVGAAALLLMALTGAGARGEAGTAAEPQVLLLPFPFYNENFGAAVGTVYGLNGFPESQSRIVTTAFGGTKGAGMVFLAGQDLRLPVVERLFIDPIFSFGYFQDTKSYIDGNPRFPNQTAGSNMSSSSNYISGSGLDYFARSRFKYLLPVGSGEEQIIPDYQLDRGLLVGGATGAKSFNPLASGRTFASLRPFYRNQQIDTEDIDQDEFRTNGIDVAMFWDNRDFPPNPSQGQGVRFEWSRDFGLFDSNASWTALEAEVDQYVDFGAADGFRQRVLAFDAWTAYSPSWNVSPSGKTFNRPPSYTGANLGGLWRMRGFPSQRFSDAAAIYYCAELRLIPDFNPFDAWPWFQQRVGVDWLQVVPFVEVGRVAPSYHLGNLHSSMKWDVGLGLRLFAKGFVVRADAAASDEDFGIQMMISQPFQF
ncbi:MAG: BamA/TamA family outer membrane protein [Rhodospirillales bacterium]|nr:BamA/TamA family outer membrane protein [Rhodospirillales bacterium]